MCFEYVGTDNLVFVFQANLDFILQENMLLIHSVQVYSASLLPATNYAQNYASIIGKGLSMTPSVHGPGYHEITDHSMDLIGQQSGSMGED